MRSPSAITLACAIALQSPQAALAHKPPPQAAPLPAKVVRLDADGAPRTAAGLCSVGIVDTALYSVNYLLPPDDAYYTLLSPDSCAGFIAPAGVALWKAHIVLHFVALCSQPVTVSVVGATGDSCLVPDPQNVLCPPTGFELTPPTTGVFDFALPLPPGCGIFGDAFLCVNFVSAASECSTVSTLPRLMTTASCSDCTSYNLYRGGFDDLCWVQFPGNPVIYAEVEVVTSVQPPDGPAPGARLRVEPGRPNPFGARATLTFSLASAGRLDVTVHDIQGRLVATLFRGFAAPGSRSLVWEGRDDAGLPVGDGLYLVSYRSGGEQRSQKIVRLR